MDAKTVNKIAIKAQEDGYDRVVKHYYRKIIEAAKVGETEMLVSITPWYNLKEKHLQFFINRDFKVEVDLKDKTFFVSWKAGF